MEPRQILIGPSTFGEPDKAALEALSEAGWRILDNPFKRKLTKKELLDLLSEDVVGLIAGLETLDREVLERSNLKVISRCGSGMTNVDIEAARGLGIKVFSTPFGPTSAVAEATLGALLCLLRMIPIMDRDLHTGKWKKRIGTQLEGKTVAIVGYGRIGSRFAELLSPFQVKILVVDPMLEGADAVFPVISFKEALPQADIISLHASGEKTIIGSDEFRAVKPGVFFLNGARGGLVDEGALVKALETGRVKGAWIDTFQQEPYSGPLASFDQVILTPHIGSYSLECRRSMEMESVKNIISALKDTHEAR